MYEFQTYLKVVENHVNKLYLQAFVTCLKYKKDRDY